MTADRMSPPSAVDFLHIAETEGPQAAYRALVQSGELMADPSQALAVEKLQGLSRALLHYKPGNG
jgi:cell division protein ZapE